MKKVIRLKESDLKKIIKRVLNEQGDGSAEFRMNRLNQKQLNFKPTTSSKENINPNNLKLGDGGSRNPEKINSVKKLQQKLINLGFLKTDTMKPTGYFGNKTKIALDKYNGVKTPIYGPKNQNQGTFNPRNPLNIINPSKNPKQGTTNPIKNTKQGTTNQKYNCIAISKEECDKISSTSNTVISTGSEKACARYMNKCLSKYDTDLAGHAWTVLNNLKSRGVATEKYNMFKNDINWDGLWRELEKSKVTNKSCKCHESDHADGNCNTGIPNAIQNSYPSKTGFDISSLELGDIVGMYYNPSTNKGQAFCQQAKFDRSGKVIKTSPFEFNTHVGFVVAIKNGVPIILHNIGSEKQNIGLHHATPATKLLSKNGTMIAWVAKDNEVKKGLESERTGKPKERGFFDNVTNWFE
jgi:hypothetical protein